MFDPNGDIPILPSVKTALNSLASAIKFTPQRQPKKKQYQANDEEDEFRRSGSAPLSPEERLDAAIKKFNAANEVRLVAETNYFAELSNDYKLLQEYKAYRNPSLSDVDFTPVSKGTLAGLYKGKPIKIKCKEVPNRCLLREINFDDGSKIRYVLFFEGAKLRINEEQFAMHLGTVLEIKSVNDRIFSELIQTPDMKQKIINMPKIINDADQILETYDPSSSEL